MSTALTDILDQLLDTPGLQGLGVKIVGTSTSGGSVTTTTTPEMMRGGTNALSTRFDGGFLLDPGATSVNQVRQITNIAVSATEATITTAGPDFDATRSDETMYVLAKDPAVIMAIANDALGENYVTCPIPLAHGPTDYHGQDSSAATGWPDSSGLNGAPAIQSTAAQVFSGAQSVSVLNDTANGYSDSPVLEGPLNGRGLAWFIARDDSGGGASLGIYDQASNLIDSIPFTNEAWILGKKEFQLDANDRGVILRRQGVGATEQVDWQCSAVVWLEQEIFHLRDTAWIDEPFELVGVSIGILHSSAYEANTWLASSLELRPLEARDEWVFSSLQADANPGQLWVRAKWLSYPLFMMVKCPWSAPYGVDKTFSSWTDATECPLRVIVATMTRKFGELWEEDFPKAEDLGREQEQAQLVARTQMHPKQLPVSHGGYRAV
jgi:hypothetical protein